METATNETMKKYTYVHSQTRYMVWEVYANSEEEADNILFEEGTCVDEWSKDDEITLRSAENIAVEVAR